LIKPEEKIAMNWNAIEYKLSSGLLNGDSYKRAIFVKKINDKSTTANYQNGSGSLECTGCEGR
jgi:hypothetical protein